MAADLNRNGSDALLALRSHCLGRLEALRSFRMSWWAYWGDLAKLYLPHRHRWFTTPNKYNRGSPKNESILDETGLKAAEVLATGIFSGLIGPTKPWFRFGIHGIDNLPEGQLKQWLSDSTATVLEVYNGSNFYDVHAQALRDLVVFGTSPILQYEDFDDIVRFYVAPAGEYFCAVNNRLVVDTLYREYTYTARMCVQEFGYKNCSMEIKGLWDRGTGTTMDQEVVLVQAIEPNTSIHKGGKTYPSPVPSKFKYREVVYQQGSAGGQRNAHIMRARGFNECPFVALRWDVTANDPYGRCPAMYAYPAVAQLQVEQLRLAEAIDKQVRPPLLAPVNLRNEPVNILPGGITYVVDPANSGLKPTFTVDPKVAEMRQQIAEVQLRTKGLFYNDLFMGISQLSTVRTATEIDARKNEIILQVGPVIERMESGEGLASTILRTYRIARRRGLIPPPPAGIHEDSLKIRYVSQIADIQRAAVVTGVERLLQVAGGMAAMKPEVLDNLDFDKIITYYGDRLDVDPSLFVPPELMAQVRQQRQAQQQAQAALQTGAAAAQAGQVLSQTDVGGGENALQYILGRAGGPRGQTLQ